MPDQLITCPNCGNEFPVTDILTESIRGQLRTELEAEVLKKEEAAAKRLAEAKALKIALDERAEALDDAVEERMEAERKKIAANERKRLEREHKSLVGELQEQLDANAKTIEEANAREMALRKQQRELEEKEKTLQLDVARQLDEGRKEIAAQAKQEALKAQEQEARKLGEQLEDLKEELEERDRKINEAGKRETELLKQQRALKEKEQSLDLEIERRLNAAQGKLYDEAQKKAEEALQLKMREKDDLVRNLQGQVKDMQRRMEQGSQESQGEALEGQLQDVLSAAFPFDTFDEVKKGTRGADITQTVRNAQGRACGKILWEAKNARNFQNPWVEKLKKDQMDAGAAVAVLMSVALPAGIERFGQLEDDGIWVCDYGSALGLCGALRQQLIQVHRHKKMVEHGEAAKDALFDYVTGPEFAMRVRAITDAFIQMKQDLDSEKRAYQRIWKKRETQIAKVLDNLVDMQGELEGTVGSHTALPAAESLTLEHLAGGEAED